MDRRADVPVVELRDLSIELGAFTMARVDLRVAPGEYMVMLGPTGSGKTVLLECILGLRRPSRGQIRLHGTDVTGLPPERRNVGYVPQDYALFPHMTVEQNVAYGPRVHGWPVERRRARVDEILAVLGIADVRHRQPRYLSGGERQRVAVGRALAVSPDVLLLDEPLSALDESRRTALAREFRRIQRQVGGAFIHVCHDLEEAAHVADRVAVMDGGAIVQVGTLEDLLRRPCTEFVARFTGCANVFVVHPAEGGAGRLADGGTLLLPPRPPEKAVTVAVRPELIRVVPAAGSPGQETELGEGTVFEGRVVLRTERVESVLLDVRTDDGSTWAVAVPRQVDERRLDAGGRLRFFVPVAAVHVIDGAVDGRSPDLPAAPLLFE